MGAVGSAPLAMGSGGVDASRWRLNHSMFALVSRSLSVKAHQSDSNCRENRPLQVSKESNMFRLVQKAIGSVSHSPPMKINNALGVVNPKARDSGEVMGEEEFLALKQKCMDASHCSE